MAGTKKCRAQQGSKRGAPSSELCSVRARLVPPVHACQLDAQVACRLELIHDLPAVALVTPECRASMLSSTSSFPDFAPH